MFFQKIKNAPGSLPEILEVRPAQMRRLDKAMKACEDAEKAHGSGSKQARRAENVLAAALRNSGGHECIAFGNKYAPEK